MRFRSLGFIKYSSRRRIGRGSIRRHAKLVMLRVQKDINTHLLTFEEKLGSFKILLDAFTLINNAISDGIKCVKIHISNDDFRKWKLYVSTMLDTLFHGFLCFLYDVDCVNITIAPFKPYFKHFKWTNSTSHLLAFGRRAVMTHYIGMKIIESIMAKLDLECRKDELSVGIAMTSTTIHKSQVSWNVYIQTQLRIAYTETRHKQLNFVHTDDDKVIIYVFSDNDDFPSSQ
jgi:hypothetical protein